MSKNEHQLVKQTRQYILKSSVPSSYTKWLYRILFGEYLHISVSKDTLERTLSLMNKFITKIEELGYELNLDSGYPQIIMNEQKFKIYCREQTKRIINTKSKSSWDQYEYIPCGILIFKTEIRGYKEWKDGEIKIEEKIDDIIEYCKIETLRIKKDKIRYWRTQRKKEILRWFELRKQKRVKEELVKTMDLFKSSQRFKISCEIRNYINEIEKNKEEIYENQKEWIEWSKNIVDWYDPTIEKEIPLLSEVDRETLTLYEELKSYVDGHRVDIHVGDENEMMNELIEILDIESDEKEEK